MAEENIVEGKTEETKEIKEEKTIEKKEDIKEQFDSSAVEELRGKVAEIEKRDEETKSKLDAARKALLGEDDLSGEDKEFYSKLANKPKEAVEDLIKKETEKLNKKFEEQQMLEKDKLAFSTLRGLYPDFEEVIKDAPLYLTKDEIEQTNGLSNRTEIRFNMIKARRELDLRGKKIKETGAINAAKEESNKTAKTEIPQAGGTMENKEEDELGKDIDTSIQEGKWNKGDGFSKLDEKMWERYERDAYGIKKK